MDEANRAQGALQQLESVAQNNRLLYDSFIQRSNESPQAQTFPLSHARVISPALPAVQTSRPKTIVALLLGAVGGFGLGVGSDCCAICSTPLSGPYSNATNFLFARCARISLDGREQVCEGLSKMTSNLCRIGFLAPAIAIYFPSLALSQIASPVDAEILALQVKCEDFKKNPDGTWISGPATRIGSVIFTNNRFREHNVIVGGVDLASVLNKKCDGPTL